MTYRRTIESYILLFVGLEYALEYVLVRLTSSRCALFSTAGVATVRSSYRVASAAEEAGSPRIFDDVIGRSSTRRLLRSSTTVAASDEDCSEGGEWSTLNLNQITDYSIFHVLSFVRSVYLLSSWHSMQLSNCIKFY